MHEYISIQSASLYELLRVTMYYMQRLVTSRQIRTAAKHVILLTLRVRYGRSVDDRSDNSSYSPDLSTSGIQRLSNLLNESECAAIRAHLLNFPLVDRRGSGINFTLEKIPRTCRLADYALEDVVNCPHVMQIANDPAVIRFASRQLGHPPTITGLNIRWSFPSDLSPDEVQCFHRDCEIGSFKILIYLTDVDSDSGPHTFADESHHDRMPFRLVPVADAEVYDRYKKISTIIGPAGTTMAIDTRGLHKGGIPSQRPRLILVIQYSLLPCFIIRYTPVRYTGASRFKNYTNRLIIQPS